MDQLNFWTRFFAVAVSEIQAQSSWCGTCHLFAEFGPGGFSARTNFVRSAGKYLLDCIKKDRSFQLEDVQQHDNGLRMTLMIFFGMDEKVSDRIGVRGIMKLNCQEFTVSSYLNCIYHSDIPFAKVTNTCFNYLKMEFYFPSSSLGSSLAECSSSV